MPLDTLVTTLTEALARALRDADHGVLDLPTLALITDQTPRPGATRMLAVWLIDLPTSFPDGLNRQAEAVTAIAHALTQPAEKGRLGLDQVGPEPPLACMLLRDDPEPDADRPILREALAVDIDNHCYLCQDLPTADRLLVLVTPPTDPRTVPDLGAVFGALSAVLQASQP
jgi:hypothetical protein